MIKLQAIIPVYLNATLNLASNILLSDVCIENSRQFGNDSLYNPSGEVSLKK